VIAYDTLSLLRRMDLLSAQDAPRLQAISDTVGGQAYFVDTVAELNDVLQYVVEFEPAFVHVKSV
jgi:hypothetical protein